jgi:hypothetical protein
MATEINQFVLKGGKYIIKKDPNAGLIYGVDMRPWLATNPGLTLNSALLTIREFAGVTCGIPFIQDNCLCVMVNGLDVSEEPVNFVTFHFYCNDGQHDDRTIYFERKEN